MSLIEVLLRRRRRTFAGPTGGLAIPRGAVNGWGTAADFYDSVGVGIKVFDGEHERSNCMAMVSQIGIRHVRDGAIPTWTVFLTAAFGRDFWAALVARNRNLPVPWLGDLGHPIFLAAINDPWGPSLANAVTQKYQANPLSTAQGAPYRIVTGTDYTPTALMQFYLGGHTHYNGNASANAALPYIGDPDSNWPVNQPELPLEAVAAFLGPNEPLGPPAGVLPTDGQWGQQARELSAWVHSMWVAKNQQTGTGYGQGGVTLTGFRRIVTEQGLSTSAPTIQQIPQVGYVPVDRDFVYNFDGAKAAPGSSLMFDISKGGSNEVDVGDDHPYWFAEEPSEERMLGSGIGITNYPAYFDGSRDINNGSQFPTPSASRGKDPNRILPIMHTEWGLVDRADNGFAAAPKDVTAEYTVRQFLLAWYWGVRRTYIYQLKDMGDNEISENNFGLYDVNGIRKPIGNALRNLLQQVGFTEPASNKRKLAITVSGYPTGQVNQSHDVNGNVYRQTAKKLHSFQIQQDDTHHLLVLSPQVKLWEPQLGNRNASNTDWQSLGSPTAGRLSPATETLTITLPTDVTAAEVAWPTRGLAPSGASFTWADPNGAMTQWDALTITNNQITVQIDRYTKLVKLTTTPRATGTALAMSRGPTGSRWGADALGPDGGLPRMPFPNYGTTSGTSFTPFAQAVDFYNSVGINTHPYYPGIGFDDATERGVAIDRIQELGIRYVRGLGLWSPAIKEDAGFGEKAQYWLIECIAANAARSLSSGGPDGAGEHPIFNQVGTPEERKFFTTAAPNGYGDARGSYEIVDADGGEPWLRSLDGPPGTVSNTSLNFAGDFFGINKTTSGAPIGWTGIELLAGPNEADNGRTTHYGVDFGIRWIAQQIARLRSLSSRAGTTILGGEAYVNYNTGRLIPGPAKMPQLPVMPFQHFTGNGWQMAGDYTDRLQGDFASFHVYWNATPPNWDYYWGNPTQQQGGFYGWMQNANAVNGIDAGLTRWDRTLPLLMTEMGHLQDPDQQTSIYCPPDVAGEYLIQQLVMNYLQGVKRSYIYKLSHEGGDQGGGLPAMGLCDTDMNRLASFYAIKNLMALVGWVQGPDEGVQPISIPHEFTPGADQFGDEISSGNQFRDMCSKLVLRRSDNEYLIFLVRPRTLWSRNHYAASRGFGNTVAFATAEARRTVASDPRNVVLHLPAGTWTCHVAEPAKNSVLSPTDGLTYANASDGQAWAATGVSGNGFTQSGNDLTVRMGGLTRVVRIVKTDTAPPPPPATTVTPALVSTSDASLSVPAANSLGAELVRMSFPITTAATSIDAYMGFYADIGAKVLLCATFNGTMPTQAEAENVATWANRFGFGGAYWSSYSGTDQPIDNIEFGHETSYQYQYGDVEANVGAGDWWNNTTYTDRAANYATRFSQAKAAIVATGKAVGLLCQADDGGSSQPNWVNTMYFAVANLHTLVSGWVIHSYGPGWEAKMDRLISQTGAHGPASVPIDVTSVGIATDDGNALDDNLLWPVNMSYAEAASALSATLQGMKGKAALSGRLRTLAIRDAHDLSDHGANTARDNYFGALKHDLSEKNEYSTTVRTEFGGQAPPPGDPSEPPILLTVTKGPYAAGTSYATAISGATSGDVIGLGAGTFNWGSQNPPAGLIFQGEAAGGTVITGEMHCTNANTKFRNLTLRAITAASQKSVLEINADGIEIDWCDIDGSPITHTTAPKPSSVFIGGIAIQVQDVKIRHSKVRGPVNGDTQSHACYVANPGPGCLVEQCWIYGFPGYGLHFNTNGSDLLANRNVIADSALRGAVVFDTASGSGPQNNTIRNCILTAQNTASGVGPIHVVAGSNFADNNKLASLGVTTPGTGTLTQSSNVVTSITYQDAAARDYRVPGDTDFQFIPGPLPSQPPPPPPPPPTTLPIVVPSVGATPATLRTGSTVGPRLHLKAVNVWGLRDFITTTFGAAQYQARATVVATIKAWGGNCIRFRMLADDYNNAPSANTGGLTKAQIVQQVKDWRDTVVGQGMYFCPCTWDALDGPFSDASWAANGYRVHQMFADVYAALGADPMVFYEVTNEPNSLGGDGHDTAAWNAWETNMLASVLYFRETMGYKGVLVIDPLWWANSGPGGQGYDDARYTTVENYDAARAGMGGKHQIVWAKHDYANNYNAKVWDPAAWTVGQGAGQIKHLIWENEFGNYNGSAATVDPTWSQNAAVFFRDRFVSQQNYVGAAPFLFGPWFDANAITASDNLTPTNPWGQTVRTNYLGSGGVTPPPPPVGWTPGIVGGSDWAIGSQASQSLGVKVVRSHDIFPGESLASIDTRILNYLNRGIRIGCLLFNFDNNVSTAQAQALGTWATRYGPGGSFWPEHPGLNESVFAIRHIEFGNEHSYQYRRGDGPGDASYQQFAQTYALRFRDAAQAIAATGRAVDLLCQADDGGSGSPVWVNSMYAAVPNLHTFVGGWVVHPYGPTGQAKLQRAINFTAARGAPGTIALDVTEAGISSDNGRTLSDNYGWPTNLTYSAATSTYQSYLNAIRADGQVGPRLRHWFYYQAYDQGVSGTGSNDRERYFGALLNSLADKGNFSAYIRSLMAS